MSRVAFAQWVQGPPLAGGVALLTGAGAVAIPTLVRAAVNGIVSGCEYSPFIPFVMLSAILLRWWQAGLVAVACVAATGLLFEGSPQEFLRSSCFETSASLFLFGSATMIGAAVLMRHVVSSLMNRGANNPGRGIVFSLENDKVWASWYDSGPRVQLGSHDKVAAVMEDFLAQRDAAARLAEHAT